MNDHLPVLVSPTIIPPSGPTLSDLICAYKTDPDSNFVKEGKLTFASRQNYASLMSRIDRDFGHLVLAELDLRQVLRMHEAWLGPDGKKVPMAHALIGMMRTLVAYGAAFMRSTACREMKSVLSDHRFQMGKARKEVLTTEQAIAVIRQAHKMRIPSIAFAQALQASGMLRQKDVIGETLPGSETKGILQSDGTRWHLGVTWAEIDDDLILRHVTSKRGKPIVLDLKRAPLVMAELRWMAVNVAFERQGPLVICERTGLPYRNYQYRRDWRMVAKAAGVPDHIFSMDTRAGQISLSIDLGAPLSAVRKAATHSLESMTMRYDRQEEQAANTVLDVRAAEHEKLLAEA